MPTRERLYDAATGKPMDVYSVDAREILEQGTATRYHKGQELPAVEIVEGAEDARKKFGDMRIEELRGLAEQMHIPDATKMKKDELVEALVGLKLKEGRAPNADQ